MNKEERLTAVKGIMVAVILLLPTVSFFATAPVPIGVSQSKQSLHSAGYYDVAPFKLSPHWSGIFEWTEQSSNAGGGVTISGSGSFNFAIDPSTFAITGSGTGQATAKVSGTCNGGGSEGYSFSMTGTYIAADANVSLLFGDASPQAISGPMNCDGMQETGTWLIGTGVHPSYVAMTAIDGETAQCPPSCFGVQLTYKITIHEGAQTSTSTGGFPQQTTTGSTPGPVSSVSISTSTTSSCTSTGDQKLIFYDEEDGFPSGHGFMQFETNSGPQAGRTDLVYGHGSVSGPFNEGFTRGPGAPQYGLLEADHPWIWRIVFHVNPCQYNAAAIFVNSEISSPSPYDLLSYNCVDWIKSIAKLAGLQLPPSTDWLGVSDPYTLGVSLGHIGNGGTFDGGLVQENTQGLTPRNTPDPPGPRDNLLASPYEILDYAVHNASALAASQNATLQLSQLQPVTLKTGGALDLALQYIGPTLNKSLMNMDFGDGWSNATSSSKYVHVYSLPGTYHANLIILNGLLIEQFSFDVTAVAGPGDSSTAVSIPISGPSSETVTRSLSSSPPLAEHIMLITLSSGLDGTTIVSVLYFATAIGIGAVLIAILVISLRRRPRNAI